MNISLSLPPEFARLIDLLDRAEPEDAEELRRAWRAGVEGGDAGPLHFAGLRQAADQERSSARRG